MTDSSKNSNNRNFKYQVPLRAVLIIPFVLQIFAAVSLVGYLSFKNGQQAIDKLAQVFCVMWNSHFISPKNDY